MNKLEFYKKKYLGFMRPDQIEEVKVTDSGFVYKGNLIVAISGLTKEIEDVTIETSKQVEKADIIIEQVKEIETKIENAQKEIISEKPYPKKTNSRKK